MNQTGADAGNLTQLIETLGAIQLVYLVSFWLHFFVSELGELKHDLRIIPYLEKAVELMKSTSVIQTVIHTI